MDCKGIAGSQKRALVLWKLTAVLLLIGAGMWYWRSSGAQPGHTQAAPGSDLDRDGDGYDDGPDHWVTTTVDGRIYREYRIGEDKDGDGVFEPEGWDGELGTMDDESDPNDPLSRPSHRSILWSGIDSDEDGIFDDREARVGTNPLDRDSDDDGLCDGDELLGIGACRIDGMSYVTNPLHPDSDLDGVPDGTELGVFGADPVGECIPPVKGTDLKAVFQAVDNRDTNLRNPRFIGTACYMPDADRGHQSTLMDPTNHDTNFDGVPDGGQDKNRNGRYDPLGEDGIAGTLDDETDAVIGVRAGPGRGSTFFGPSKRLWLPMYDENNPTLYDPPPKVQKLYFYWGSSEHLALRWIFDSTSIGMKPEILIRENADVDRQAFEIWAQPEIKEGVFAEFTFEFVAVPELNEGQGGNQLD